MSKKPSSLTVAPNVTPMIDVMLVLLIIFMIVAPLLVTGFRATPPEGVNLTAHPEEPSDAVIGIDAAGNYFYDHQPVSESDLIARLTQRFQHAPANQVSYLLADQSLSYGRVRDAMDLAATTGVRVIGLIGETPHTSTPRGSKSP